MHNMPGHSSSPKSLKRFGPGDPWIPDDSCIGKLFFDLKSSRRHGIIYGHGVRRREVDTVGLSADPNWLGPFREPLAGSHLVEVFVLWPDR